MTSSELVLTWPDYYDGPRRGIATFKGQPHLFVSEWDHELDEYASTYLLEPVDPSALPVVLEDWAIWRRWARAFHRGETTRETHPVLPTDRKRWHQLRPLIAHAYAIPAEFTYRVTARFQRHSKPEDYAPGAAALTVDWTVLETPVTNPHPAAFGA